MEIILLSQHWAAILSICIIIGSLALAYTKKIMISYALIISNIIVFVISYFYYNEIIYGFTIPGINYAGLGFRSIYLNAKNFPQIYTILTSMFIHGGFAHIFGNMFIFFFIGIPFEDRIGAKKFLLIYLLTGICGTLTHSVLNQGSEIPLIGASGAIFGIMGAFAFAYPKDEVVMPIGIYIMFLTKIKVIFAVLFFAIIETVIIWWESQTGMVSSTAHYAHLGGLISGFIISAILIRGKTHTKHGKTIYYDSFSQPRVREINYSKLSNLAKTKELKTILKKVENENVPQVREIWLEHFFEKTYCPKCGNKLNHFDRKAWCDKCDFKINY
jgi:membrane associated rhomboid family serine protease